MWPGGWPHNVERSMTEKPPSLDLIFSEVKERLGMQFQAIDSLDSKAGLILTGGSVVISVAAAVQASLNGEIGTAPLTMLIGGAIAYGLTMIYAVLGLWVQEYRRDPDPGALSVNYMDKEEHLTKRQIVTNLVESFDINVEVLKDKAVYIQCAMVFLVLETSLLVAALIWRSM